MAGLGGALAAGPWMNWLSLSKKGQMKIGACDWSIEEKGDITAFYFAQKIGLGGVQVSFMRNDWEAPSSGHSLQPHPRIVALNDILVDKSLPLAKRVETAQEMAEDSTGGIFLISLAAQHELPEKVKDAVSKTIVKNPDRYVRGLAHAYFKDEKEHKSYDIDHISSLKSNINDGKNLFYQKCIICHSTGNGGGQFGPSLANINRKYDKRGLLNAIVHPAASVAFGFEPYIITTKDGKAAYGLLRTEGDIVVLKGIYGDQYVFEADNINSKIQLSTSIMPRPYTFKVSDQQLANLTTYLMNLDKETK